MSALALVNLKARFGWSDKSFTKLLVLLKKILLEDNTLLKDQYEAKKILCPVGMEYQKIHSCPNDCILYENQFVEMCKCPTCGVSQYKVKDEECCDDKATNNDHPTKVCWYLPIIPRFKRLFANGDGAKNLTWKTNGRKSDGLL